MDIIASLSRTAVSVRGRIDGFVLALFGVVLAATFLPCRGESASLFHAAGILAIGALFFLQGARLSRDAVLSGMLHWRLHAAIGATTFVVFPLLGLGLLAAFPHLLPRSLLLGVLFVCALPSTVQSSIALTSIAGGNVPGAVCSATVSNIAGIVLAPLLFGAMSNLHGGGINLTGLWQVVLQLLVPFTAGHLLRPWIGTWAERNRAVLSITDRSSILLVVYTAFSAAVAHGIWQQIPPSLLAGVALLMALLIALVLFLTTLAGRALGFGRDDEAALVFCGSQKSLVSGVPIANALVSGAAAGPLLLPLMLYYPMQMVVCAWIARRYADVEEQRNLAVADAPRPACRRRFAANSVVRERLRSSPSPAVEGISNALALCPEASALVPGRRPAHIERDSPPGRSCMDRLASAARRALLAAAIVLLAGEAARADDTILRLSETATIMVTPDELVASMRAESVAPAAQDAQRRVNEMMRDAVATAKKVDGITVTTGGYNVWRIGATPADRSERWQAGQNLNLSGKDAETMLKLVGDLQQRGFAQGNLGWRLSPAIERAARKDATKQALSGLRGRADEAADILGLRFSAFKEVRLDSVAPPPVMPRQAMAMRASSAVSAPPPSAETEDMPVTASAEADVLLKPR